MTKTRTLIAVILTLTLNACYQIDVENDFDLGGETDCNDGLDDDGDGLIDCDDSDCADDEWCYDVDPTTPTPDPDPDPEPEPEGCAYWITSGLSGVESGTVLYISGVADVASVTFRCERGVVCDMYTTPANPEAPGGNTFFVYIPAGGQYNGASPRSASGGWHNLGHCEARSPGRVLWTETETGGYLGLF